MGFLKFLKREKKEDKFDELDLPPAPPSLEGFEENEHGFPDFSDIGKNAPAKGDMPEFDFPENEEKFPEFPSLPELEETLGNIPPVSAPPSIPQPSPIFQPLPEPKQEAAQEKPEIQQEIRPKREGGIFRHEQSLLEKKQEFGQAIKRGRTIYLRVDKFKAALGSINMVRNDLKKSEEALIKLENIKNTEDKSFVKIKSSLEDLQKKFIFVDKTLFKGD